METDVMNHGIRHHTFKPLVAGVKLLVLLTLLVSRVQAQSDASVYHHDVAKQRLLIRLTSHYVHTVSQGQIDMDSAVRVPCRVYGLSPMLAYNEGYSDGKPSTGTRLLDVGKIREARRLLGKLQHEPRIRLLIELGSYLVFKPGAARADLDEAAAYTREAISLSTEGADLWKIESLTLQAFLEHQSGLADQSQQTFAQVIALCEQANNERALAQALLSAGRLLPYGHPSRLANFEKARSIFQMLRAPEKEIETGSEITIEYFALKRYADAQKNILLTLKRQDEIQFHHNQYSYDALSFMAIQKGDIPVAMDYSQKSLASLLTRQDSVLAPYFFSRRAGILENLNKYDEALYYYDKSLETRSAETRLFWYNDGFPKARVLNTVGRHQEALSFLQELVSQFPPVSTHQKMHVAFWLGYTYQALKQWNAAEKQYNAFLTLSDGYPIEYIHGEFAEVYFRIAAFYRIIGKTSHARALLKQVKPLSFKLGTVGKGGYYEALFKIDSTEHRYADAMNNLLISRAYFDSAFTYEQRKKAEELLVKYEAEKKDKDIQLLKQQTELQQARLQQSQFTQRMTVAGAALLLFIAALLYYLYWAKQKSNVQLKHLVSEKEWLLKEVHHRVKNNLQTVLSLLESQSRQLTNEALDAVQESQNRVYAMSLIHKKLYQSTDVASIDMEDYLRDLIQHLRESFGRSGAIRFTLQLSPINLDVSQAVPIGLIVNEAITNSIKYAFPEYTLTNEIFVSLTAGSDKIELMIADNGIGMPVAYLQTSKSLGLKLMQGLTEDIDGFFTIDTEKGVSIQIQFAPTMPLQKVNLVAWPAPKIQNV
jgi:two-component system, sensor histidine kinase PdtaS